jgi:hypothetical protein
VIGFDLFTECLSLLFLLLSGSAPGLTALMATLMSACRREVELLELS